MILFAAINIPPSIAKDIARFQKGVSGARWRSTEQLHITLGYFGELTDERAEQLDEELARKSFPAFELCLKNGGHFGHNQPHSLWAGIEDESELASLNTHCKNAARRAGIIMEKRLYRPHVTMAYLRAGAPLERIIAFEKNMMARFKSRPFLVDQFELYSSNPQKSGGNLYRMEASYPLMKPA